MSYEINRAWCKGCGICMAFCPKKALSLDADTKAVHTPELCIACGLCERYCPDLAISMEGRRKKTEPKHDAPKHDAPKHDAPKHDEEAQT